MKTRMIQPRPIAAIRLDGGRMCLDFVNTIHDRHAPALEDYISTSERFFEWSLRVGAIDSRASRWPTSRRLALAIGDDVRRLRHHLHSLFSALIDGTPVPAAAAHELNKWVHHAWRQIR